MAALHTNDYSELWQYRQCFGASCDSDGVLGGAYSFDGNDFIRVDGEEPV
jgi:hypothetical protein